MKNRILSTAILLLMSSVTSLCASITFPGHESATVGISVVRLSDGASIYSTNALVAMIPASITKCITSAATLINVGEEYTIETKVEIGGEIVGGVLNGNLIIHGAADPTIDSSNFKDYPILADEIILSLQELGIKRIDGCVIVDDDNFIDAGVNPQWTVGDVGESYGAGLYGFNYCDNLFTLSPATLETVPEQPYIDLILEPSNEPIEIVHGTMSDNYYISGKGLESLSTKIVLPMNNPALSYCDNIVAKLTDVGIEITGNEYDDCDYQLLMTHKSPAVIEILSSLMTRSDNMMAEAMLRLIAPAESRSKALTKEIETLKNLGISTEYIKLNDGSGLARINRVTPKFMTSLLTKMAKGSLAKQYVSLFPVAGKTGTVKNLLKGTRLAGRLALKSGSINGVHCYAGYKLDSKGTPTHAITIMVNNFFCSRDKVRQAITKWLLDTF